jgi:hypothetical protein
MQTHYFYERNRAFIESPINKTFEEVLWMTTDEFREWIIEMRKLVVKLWDEEGQPPRVGYDEHEIIAQFQQMESFVVNQFEAKDAYAGGGDVVRCTSNLGNAVNQFFPTMMKTRINYSKDPSSGKSIYDYFAKDELLETFITYATRHFKRDSFYNYSRTLAADDTTFYPTLPVASTGREWIAQFEAGNYRTKGWDYWLAPQKDDTPYTGYNVELREKAYLDLSRFDIDTLQINQVMPDKCLTNVDYAKSEFYRIRIYQYGKRVFPEGLKAFRVSFCQYAVNFPPLIAKYIYERFTQEWKREDNIYVWDPSSGWGGRLLGALSVEDGRHLTYLGNDPNTDHNTTPGRTKYHEIHSFYREHVQKGGLWGLEHTGFQFWQKGSEEMQHDPEFQQYKGKLSLVFTSPPYFAKEAYSEDDQQSYKKFSQYDLWRDGFLKETLKTAVEWLRPGGYIAWNIADAAFGNDMLPLEQDSRSFLESLGMQYQTTIKMALAQMPGGNRLDAVTGLPKSKNFCKVNDLWLKYEPIFIYRKPQ